ncbi:uncharacterized protein [Periplaneta americana]|uniref:uncharacterized protein isoform X4 n=1 Tax=Periplaneta americana TaxID=6978 RepID=UPI0037E6F90B
MLGMKRAYGRTDADRICRLCSSNSGIIVLNIFDGEGKKRRILSLINSCLPVKISENDSLPKVICHHCLHKLEVFREFQESCLKSEETLRKFSTYSVTYPAFRNASQEFIRENEETVSRFSAELLPIPVPLEQHQQQSSGAVATTVVEERSEERTGVQRREIYEHSPADQLEVIMVKEEPQEEIAAGDEDSRWQDTSIEEENVMQAEETELDLISPGDRIKSEDCGSIEPPVLRIERDFIVTKTNRGKRCLLRGQYKYRKARETRGGFIVWRCTNSNCSALLKTDNECTTLYNSRNIHNHKEISWQKLARNVFHKACKCKRWGMNSNFLCSCVPSTSNTNTSESYHSSKQYRNKCLK